MSNGFKLSTVLPAPPAAIYRAWLDPREHAAFTGGGAATSQPRVGGAFSAWDGYIFGTYLAFKPGERIVHSWRTTDFPPGVPDSRVEVLLAPARGGTRLTLVHAQIPPGQEADYESGWSAFYFRPMKKYFAQVAAKPKPAKRAGKARRPAAQHPSKPRTAARRTKRRRSTKG